MKTLMIVEDEKLIRQGIKSMVLRSGVDVEEIIECNNGLAALEILEKQNVDVMFTDIRMPKMDGISLVKEIQKMTLNKTAIVKYDAFKDVGGKLSFALALLDRENTGIILNAVHSRDNCFLYLKEIVKGESYVMLSQEELEALRKAVNFGLENIEKDE